MAIKINRTNQHNFKDLELEFKGGVHALTLENYQRLKYPQWAPAWDARDDHQFENLKPFYHSERGYFGDPSFENFLKGTDTETKVETKLLSPKLGTEVKGLQLSKLTDKQKDDLALLVEQRGVVVFRDQDFKELPFEDIKEWGRYFGPLHIHPNTAAPLDHPEFHVVFRRGTKDKYDHYLANRLNSIVWHSDVSFELQPPGITLFAMLQTSAGGDTQFIDLVTAYERLSPLYQQLIDDLQLVHSSKQQASKAKKTTGVQRKEEVESVHPLVRYHPVLKKKSLFMINGFGQRILGLKQEESDNIINFLNNHIRTCLDAHIRANWDEHTITVWDNRRVIHTATGDWDTDSLRHAFRLTTLAERPVGSEEEFNDWTPELEIEKLKDLDDILDSAPAEYYEKYSKGGETKPSVKNQN